MKKKQEEEKHDKHAWLYFAGDKNLFLSLWLFILTSE